MSTKYPKPPFRKYKKEVYKKIIATCDFIFQLGEYQDLRKPLKEVAIEEIASKEFKKKIFYVKKCLIKYRLLTGRGRGIGAVQVGIPDRFFVIYMPEIKEKFLTVINPKITNKSEKLLRYPEMCMSASPIITSVVRPSWIEFEYLDEKGKKQYWKTKDNSKKGRMYNRVFQHEIDHMDGIINIDLVQSRELIFESGPSYYEKARFEEA